MAGEAPQTDGKEDGVMAKAAQKIEMSIPEFDAFIESMAEGQNFELFDGVPLLMSNPGETHEQIAGNIGANLKLAMDKRGCRTYQGGMMVQASANSTGRDKFRTDVVVRCGSTSNNTFIADPVEPGVVWMRHRQFVLRAGPMAGMPTEAPTAGPSPSTVPAATRTPEVDRIRMYLPGVRAG